MTKYTRWFDKIPFNKKLYFAYGSNMNKEQMCFRCPKSQAVATAQLPGYRFLINSRGVATIIPDNNLSVYGILWVLSAVDEATLDFYEGVKEKIYFKRDIKVKVANNEMTTLTYIANEMAPGVPREGYLERVIEGAQSFQAHQEWLQELESWSFSDINRK